MLLREKKTSYYGFYNKEIANLRPEKCTNAHLRAYE